MPCGADIADHRVIVEIAAGHIDRGQQVKPGRRQLHGIGAGEVIDRQPEFFGPQPGADFDRADGHVELCETGQAFLLHRGDQVAARHVGLADIVIACVDAPGQLRAASPAVQGRAHGKARAKALGCQLALRIGVLARVGGADRIIQRIGDPRRNECRAAGDAAAIELQFGVAHGQIGIAPCDVEIAPDILDVTAGIFGVADTDRVGGVIGEIIDFLIEVIAADPGRHLIAARAPVHHHGTGKAVVIVGAALSDQRV